MTLSFPMQRDIRGFTLIEVLVVVIIVAIMSSVAMLSTGLVGGDDDLDTERRRLATLIETVQDEAMMQGREFGIEVMRASYRFVEFDPLSRQWMDIPGDELYRLRNLPEGLEFKLFVDEKEIELVADPQKLDAADDEMQSAASKTYVPHLFVFASGEASVFEIRVRRLESGQELIMRGDILGEIEFGEDDEI